MNGIRFCLSLTHHLWTAARDPRAAIERTVELARLGDEAGIESLWVSEDPDSWDAFAVLGALAGATERVRLGPGVTNPYHRHPNLLAASTATLDRLTGGRAFLGLGRGQTEWYARALGMDVGKPLAVLEETIRLLRAWWAPPHRASADGHFRIREWERRVHPTRPAPPIYLAAVGPGALRLAGQLTDGVLFNDLASNDYLRGAIAEVRDAARAAGRDPDRLAFYLRTRVVVTDDPAPELTRAKTTIALIHALPGMDRLLTMPEIDVPTIMTKVRRVMKTEEILAQGGAFPALRRVGDLAAARAAIPDDLVARVTIAGPLSHVRNRLRELAAIGITHVFVAPPASGTNPATFAASLDDLAQSVRREP